MSVFLLILGIVLFIGLVVVHEWGHFIAARRAGVEVEEFGIGFPPKVWGKKIKTAKSRFLFTINLLPLGGFVRLKGESDDATAKGSYGAAPLPAKVKIMLAGVGMNLVVAFGLLTIVALMGMPTLVSDQFTVASDTKITREVENKGVVKVSKVGDNTPASRAGLMTGDQIISIGDQKIDKPDKISQIVGSQAGQRVEIIVSRAGQQQTLSTTLNAKNDGSGLLGISSQSGEEGIQLRQSTWSAPVVAGGLIGQFTKLTFEGFGKIFSSLFKGDTKTASEQVTGPVGIVKILEAGSKIGINFILMITAIISLSLAIMNVLPIPALDGGRLFVTLAFRAVKKPLTKSREEWIHGTGFVALMGLFVLITIVDVKRFF